MKYFIRLSHTDDLTGLSNFRYLKLYLKNTAKKYKIVLAIIDLNNFKKFNEISISKGDEVLIEFSNELNNLLISKAILFRYRMGDEFALVFHNKNKDEIISEIKMIKSYFKKYSFKCLPDMKDYRIDFCYGLSEIDNNSTNIDKLFEVAELELANGKRE